MQDNSGNTRNGPDPNADLARQPTIPVRRGRGAQCRPANRFESTRLELTLEQLAEDEIADQQSGKLPTRYYWDDSQSVVTENKSPDVGFRFSINPYRGCAHGCSYCYARPTHEYLGFDAGLDFETKILVKTNAPQLFEHWLSRPSYAPEPVMMSGVTDCYQPAEQQFQLARRCLEVARQAGQPMNIVTKNALVTRDKDLLSEMGSRNLVRVALSITSLDESLCAILEPRTSRPAARLRAIEQLSRAGISTHLMIAPVIPGLNDHEIPAIVRAAASAGVQSAGYVMLRLPGSVKPVFFDWLEKRIPNRAARVKHRIESVRDGKHYDARFGSRMRGTGIYAGQIRQTFEVFAKQAGLWKRSLPLSTEHFRRPSERGKQRTLF